jgi:predicted nucleotidyltransferase
MAGKTRPARRQPSGRFVLRIDPGLHAVLRRAAREAGLSLNDYCARRLAEPPAPAAAPDALGLAVRRAVELFGEDLVGVAAFGSWTRGELRSGSDLDLLVVLEPRVRLDRRLYRRWDEQPLEWGGRVVESHFAHLPAVDAAPSGIWAEVAIDGIVLFERGFRLSAVLVRVRHEIVSGRLVRKVAHGQPYWVRVEVA